MNNRFHQAIPQLTETYREATRQQLWLCHQRKKCECGTVITEKQMRQQAGSCNQCWAKTRSTNTNSAASAQSVSDLRQGGV